MAESLNDRLARNADLITGEIYTTTVNRSIWNKLIPKIPWENGMSDTQQVLTVERNLAANPDTWEQVAVSNNSNNCVPAVEEVPRGYTTREFSLVRKALESDTICVEDGRNAYMTNQQIQKMFENLRDNVAYVWKRRAQLEYVRVSEHKVIATHGLPQAAGDFPPLMPTTVLTQKILNKIYVSLVANSAEIDGGSLVKVNGRPQFILVTDMETSDEILREDSTNNAFLWNDERVKELLSPLGVDRAFRGFMHTIDLLPRRFTFNGGVFTEVQPYLTGAATSGYKAILNPAWESALITESYVFLPSVMSFAVPNSITTYGAGSSFNPQAYIGTVKWLNILHKTDNPDGNQGFYRAVLMSGTKPEKPQFGWVIRHLRCVGDIGHQECPATGDVHDSDLSDSDSYLVAD